MIISLPKKYRPLIALGVLLIVIGCIVWLGLLPLKQSIVKKMQDIQEFYAGRENREKQVDKLPELQGQYDAILENEKTFNILITEDKVVDFVKILETLASATNVTLSITSKDNGKIIESKKPEKETSPSSDADQQPVSGTNNAAPKTPNILDTVPFGRYLFLSVKTEGRYSDIVKFLGKAEALPFGLDVIKVDIKKKDAENNSQATAARSPANPFAILGDNSNLAQKQPPTEGENKNGIEAVFDMLVYVKKTDL